MELPSAIYYASKQQKKEDGIAIYCTTQVYDAINQHVSADLEREYGGFLLGTVHETELGDRYILIDASTPAQFTKANEVRLNFTNDTFLQLANERATIFQEKEVLGWYHSHPKMDIFLSSLDVWIHNGYFKESYKVALVVEPQKHLGGFFKRIQKDLSAHDYYGFHLVNSPSHVLQTALWNNLVSPSEKIALSEKAPDTEKIYLENSVSSEKKPLPKKETVVVETKGKNNSSEIAFHWIYFVIFFLLGFIIFPLMLHLNTLKRVEILQGQMLELGHTFIEIKRDLRDLSSEQQAGQLELQIEIKKVMLETNKLYLRVQDLEQFQEQSWKIQLEQEKSREKMVREMRQMKRDLFRSLQKLTEHLFRMERMANLLLQKPNEHLHLFESQEQKK